MRNEQRVQIDDLQKTVLIPVLSLQVGSPAATSNPAAASAPTAGKSGSATSVARALTAADAICERVLRDKSIPGTCTNPILVTAVRLTTLASLLRTADAPGNFVHFSQLLIDAVREFDHELVHTQVRHDAAMVARYVLCCIVDEAVLSTPWGLASGWAHRSLLRLFHNEANGGERFFSLLEHALRHQHDCRDLLELFYLCLALGFEGRLHFDPRGQDKLEALRTQLFRILYSGLPRQGALSSNWRPVTAAKPATQTQPALRFVGFAALIAVVLCIAGMRLWLHVSAYSVATAYEGSFHFHSSSERR